MKKNIFMLALPPSTASVLFSGLAFFSLVSFFGFIVIRARALKLLGPLTQHNNILLP